MWLQTPYLMLDLGAFYVEQYCEKPTISVIHVKFITNSNNLFVNFRTWLDPSWAQIDDVKISTFLKYLFCAEELIAQAVQNLSEKLRGNEPIQDSTWTQFLSTQILGGDSPGLILLEVLNIMDNQVKHYISRTFSTKFSRSNLIFYLKGFQNSND